MFKIIAHRGASAKAPENTFASFRLALRNHADILEMDIRLSSDNEIVVIHDASVNRTTDGTGKVSELTSSELKRLDSGSWFSPEYREERIPLLREVFAADWGNATLNVEIKGTPEEYPRFSKKIVRLVEEYGMEDKVVLTSFNNDYLEEIKKINPDISVGIVYNFRMQNYREKESLPGVSEINPLWYFLSKKFVRKAHDNKIKIYPWTVNSRFAVSYISRLGVDGAITNKPGMVYSILKERGIR